ncbi:hypothetical protein O3P69_013579 [Scylla paramamosain]|uniref:Single domain-containing protein n=1 Tax=Scylla paramamosain TaxID=85552 RepID=A0AAW0SS59_SCYPA
MVLMARQCQAATGLGQATVHPDHSDKCWVEKQQKAYAIGEKWMGEYCIEYTCQKSSTGLALSWNTCPKLSTQRAGCTIMQDLTLDYPKCCPRYVC